MAGIENATSKPQGAVMSFWKKIAIAFTVLAAVPVTGALAAADDAPAAIAASAIDDTPWG
ncbi:hypothetical protein AB0I53_43480 [Saccharopolyspora sp. NPDC050389]|uniref:hypothetical protein n=1 Tax=Saccharopolyspora sp. NPDC050389 TaxID=3155516 RepID=UPI0033EC75C2